MRNLGGIMGQRKLTRSLLSALYISDIKYSWQHRRTKTWSKHGVDETDIVPFIGAIGWSRNGRDRTLIFNLKVPLIEKNVDLCLFRARPDEFSRKSSKKSIQHSPAHYLALGELKAGIDPAGADEHWKTASAALQRIADAFSRHSSSPSLFFIGAAIEKSMASEIFARLRTDELANAANLTDDDQIASICRWIVDF